MRSYYKPHNDIEWYYINYLYKDHEEDTSLHEFWADNYDEFLDKYTYVTRHARYTLLAARTPLTD